VRIVASNDVALEMGPFERDLSQHLYNQAAPAPYQWVR
jgi:hypothetical protein